MFRMAGNNQYQSVFSVCVVCGIELTADVRSEIKNVCRFCLHDLEV